MEEFSLTIIRSFSQGIHVEWQHSISWLVTEIQKTANWANHKLTRDLSLGESANSIMVPSSVKASIQIEISSLESISKLHN